MAGPSRGTGWPAGGPAGRLGKCLFPGSAGAGPRLPSAWRILDACATGGGGPPGGSEGVPLRRHYSNPEIRQAIEELHRHLS
jgi:hypothetical protein